MDINITVILQAINFLATYAFLHHYLFKPVIVVLHEKKRRIESLETTVTQEENLLFEQQKEKLHQVVVFQTKTKESFPVIEKEMPFIEFDLSYERNLKEIESLTSQAKNYIVKQVPRVK